jgi:UDP-galactopyranose mutase
MDYAIIVHCHLRWDFVWQRPQQIMSRLSKYHPVLFLEDAAPLPDGETEPRMQLTHWSDALTVARPLLLPHVGDPVKDAETDRINGPAWRRLLDDLVADLRGRDHRWDHIIHWFYTPMAAGAREFYDPVAVAYDCMDELANFKFAPPDMKQREADLMAAADVVFTGGPSMYAARKDRHPNVHQFNSGVDVDHFRKALAGETDVPEDVARLSPPVLLYFGVIDERMGWDNIAALCDAHAEWNVVLVGPLAKITEDDLPRRPNLHYTGQRHYEDLPGYLKGCDVALIPFAMSDATRYLSPTKTLEYFAARKPVVSTPIVDIVEHYSDAARIAYTPEEFVRACEAALSEENTARLDAGERYAEAQTWDRIVDRMHALLDAAVANETPSLAVGHVRWYSGSRGVGLVETEKGQEIIGFMPGAVQEELGCVHEGDPVAVGAVAGAAAEPAMEHGPSIFPLGLDKRVSEPETTRNG